MEKPSFTTPKTIERDKRDREARKSKKIINDLSIDKDIKSNVNTFIEGYNHELDIYYNVIDDIKEQKEQLNKQKEQDRITETIFKEQLKELEAKKTLFNDQTKTNLTKLSKNLKSIYKEKAEVSGSNINDDDVKLLKSGIKLTQKEIKEMTSKYNSTNNQTMLRIIKGYADDNNIPLTINQADDQIKGLEQVMNLTMQGLEDEFNHMGRRLSPKYRNSMVDMIKHNLNMEE